MGLARRAALLGLPLLLASAVGAADFVDGIAAQVGSDIVLASEVQRFAEPVETKMKEAGAPEDEILKMRAEILERMIERRLLEQAIRRTEIDATDAEVDQAIAAIAAENGLETETVRKSVEQQGLTWEAYRQQIRSEIQRQKLVSAMVHSKVRIEDADLRKLYQEKYANQPTGGEEVHLRQILVPFTSEDPAGQKAACAEVEAARARIVAGAKFAEVAAETTVVNPRSGGDVGWLHTSSVAGWMSDAIKALGPGEISPVIRMPFGCNLLLLEERRDFEPKSFEQAREELYRELFEQGMSREYAAFLERLREQTYIERKGMYAEAAPSLTKGLDGPN